jgi:head-tail adaptor
VRPIKAGKLDQVFTLQKPTTPETFDSFGQPVPNYTTVGTFWGELIPLRGREAVIAKQVYAEATHTVNMRWLGSGVNVNPTDRLVRTDTDTGQVRTFGIVSVSDVETKQRLYTMLVQEIQQTGRV